MTLFDDGAFKNGIASCHDMVNWVFEKGHHFEEKQCCILIQPSDFRHQRAFTMALVQCVKMLTVTLRT